LVPPAEKKSLVKSLLTEAVLVTLLGITLSFAANSLSVRGLKLTRNYFPGPSISSHASTPASSGTNAATVSTPSQSPAERAIARLNQKGLQVVDDSQMPVLFQDPNYQTGSIIFVDARDDDHYQKGHIPGAYQLDHMYAEKYLGTVLPACNTAQQIVVYCGGGDCEKSEFVAELLRAAVPNNKIFIYVGGMTDWQARKSVIEKGERNSGQLSSATP
jgi:rhodanese-related sulfurtransferase